MKPLPTLVALSLLPAPLVAAVAARLPPPESTVLRQADDAFHAAKQTCQEAGVADRALCIDRARRAHAETLAQAGVRSLPALQTQSSAVSATGVAANAVSERVHGAPDPLPRHAVP
ncbi:hypothetical protein WG922_01180 [Ramlibacter sp. AN1015]|uniref:hypothetical protein n=1 Tax=Ramlibacter sp. AN1015 TaxID=3133428 RepID=UPI0030BD56C3